MPDFRLRIEAEYEAIEQTLAALMDEASQLTAILVTCAKNAKNRRSK